MSAEQKRLGTQHFYSGFLCLWALLILRVSPAKTLGVSFTRRFALTQFLPCIEGVPPTTGGTPSGYAHILHQENLMVLRYSV
ncbi:hypothetical protein SD81_002875 [Tolypothrix campylonemoides VB511288]|nr:hypothetical protein SD81_002875 [Tolypothrix campylonemoides VB511288]